MARILSLLKISFVMLLLSLPIAANAELIKLLDFTETAEEDEGPIPSPFTFENLLGIEGFNVTFTTNTGANHWLDAGSGLGICPLDDCNANYEDNINAGEGLTFEFTLGGSPFAVEDFTMFFVGHDNEGGVVDSTILNYGEFPQGINSQNNFWMYRRVTDIFTFTVTSGELYLGSIWIDDGLVPPQGIPEPGNILLFLTGMAGLLLARKKRGENI
ncbi:PEP-CTERM sorting domain-containing protein [Thalassotalea litorea]|uniref:PEP-CTERM sorting domain-containing protein n=1 Tax=Thalassotalea litorea TaxID=2020715 RepID=A0A5R9IT28_9GAMM|nr:PEP-CTERM sorting domain-containing protein [Thalassotalea litorea]TLU65078.1 PEP-CTERM sorting domain-containing protein [Thalassotalea litorea]